MSVLCLNLVLSYYWFEEMVAGRKYVEYRAVTPHWTRLIWKRRDQITHARFSKGYTSTTITRRVLFVSRGSCPYEGWNGDFYRLHLDCSENGEH